MNVILSYFAKFLHICGAFFGIGLILSLAGLYYYYKNPEADPKANKLSFSIITTIIFGLGLLILIIGWRVFWV